MSYSAIPKKTLLPLLAAVLSLVLTGSRCTASIDADAFSPVPEVTAPQRTQSGFLHVELGEEAIYRGNLILVNNAVPCRTAEPQGLVSVGERKSGSYFVRSLDMMAEPETIAALNAMLDDFLAQGGSKTVNLVALWRSEDTQQRLFDRSAARNGLDHARRYVALPGHSEHHTGLAADLSLYFSDGTSADFTGEGEYGWITENAARYGLIVRYAEDKESITGIAAEPWHFRYVGVPHALKMTELQFCLEEYLDYLRSFPFEGEHLFIDNAGERYEVWYEEGCAAHLPIEGEYTVSGDNVGGIIVTRKLLDGDLAVRYTNADTIALQ